MNGIAYIDGVIEDLHEAKIPLNDRGYLLGDGVFETLRVSNGRIFRMDDHAARLREGLRAVGLEPELDAEFHAAAAMLVAAGKERLGDDLYLRIQVSTGPMDDILSGDRGILVTGLAKPFKPYPMEYLNNGVDLIFSTRRKDRFDPLSRIKTLSFLPYVAARREAHACTAHDALLRNDAGRVAEGTTSNIFAVQGDTVYAPGPDEGAVDGVTRRAVLEILADEGLGVEERLEADTLRRCDEAWLSNTTGGVVPMRSLEGKPLGAARHGSAKGPLAAKVQHRLEDLVRGA